MKTTSFLPLSFRPVRLLLLLMTTAVLFVIGCDLLETDDPIDSLANPLRRIFRGRLTYATGETPYELLIGDLNRDGLPDVVTLDWTVETASVLLADGAGDYEEPVSYELGEMPRAAALQDFNGDNILDLAVVTETYAQVTFFFGDGTGALAASTVIDLAPESAPRAIVAADLNNDGIMDLVTAETAAFTVTLHVGDGAGTFLEPVSFPLEYAPAGLWVGDATGDDIIDILVANPDNNTLSLLEGTGIEFFPVRLLTCGDSPQLVTASDLDNDGNMDLIAANMGSGDLSVLYGRGEGLFSGDTRIPMPYPVGRFVVADLNGNTIPDIAALLFDSTTEEKQPLSRFAVLPGIGDGTFDAPDLYGAGWGALGIAAADMDEDGAVDLVTADYSANSISIAYNHGNARFESDTRFVVGSSPEQAIAADFTQDGKNDLAVLNFDSNTISLLENTGTGVFEAMTPITLSGSPLFMAAGDLNHDNRTDLVVSLTVQNQVVVYLSTGPCLFAAATFFPLVTDVSRGFPEALSLALGDVDNDGNTDILAGNSKLDSVSVLLNDGAGRFAAPIVSEVGNYPRNVHLTDTNADGFLDLVFLSSADPTSANDTADPRVIRWFGIGDGTFDAESHLRFATSESPVMLAMGDITGNGRLDAITVHPDANCVYVLGGLNSGNFSQASRIYIGYEPITATLADVNYDGLADLIVTLSGGSIIVRFSRGDLGFEDLNNFVVSPGMVQSIVSDISEDGVLDLIVVNALRDDIGVLLGQAL